jgi:hypothetical protein
MHTKLKELLKLSSSIVLTKKKFKSKKKEPSKFSKKLNNFKVLTKFVHYLPI